LDLFIWGPCLIIGAIWYAWTLGEPIGICHLANLGIILMSSLHPLRLCYKARLPCHRKNHLRDYSYWCLVGNEGMIHNNHPIPQSHPFPAKHQSGDVGFGKGSSIWEPKNPATFLDSHFLIFDCPNSHHIRCFKVAHPSTPSIYWKIVI
jgi:hypothetical protein